MLEFAVCPHDTYKGVAKWIKFTRELGKLAESEVKLITFSSFREERERLEESFDIYYASPSIAAELYKKGYMPAAKIREQEDSLLLVGKEPPKEEYTVALADLKAVKYGLLAFERIDLGKIRVLYTESHEETLQLVDSGVADYGIVYEENLESWKGRELKVIERINLGTSHLFMVKGERVVDIRDKLLRLPKVVPAGEEDIKKVFELEKRFEKLLKRWEEYDIAMAVLNAPAVGILIYQEGIVYVNNYLCELLGYEREELLGKPAEIVVAEEERERIREVIRKRLSGEKFTFTHRELKFRKKDGSEVWTSVFSSTILYEGKYAGFVVVIDITKRKRLEGLYKLIREVNQAITQSLLEEELFERICRALTEKMGLRFVWVGKPDENGWVRPVVRCGHEEGYLEKVRISVNPEVPEGRGPTGTALREGRIVINPDTKSNPAMGPWREEMLKRGYLSSCAVPIQVEGETVYVLNLYASEPYFFEEENREVLEELKGDIEFGLSRMREFRNALIISKALELTNDWVLVTDRNGNILYVNDAVCRISGYEREELIGKNPRVFKSGLHDEAFYKKLWETILSGKSFHAVFVNRKKDGELFHIEQTIAPVELPGGEKRFVSVGRDITRELEMSEEIEKLKFYDALTGLLNLSNLALKVSETLKKGEKAGALIVLDLYNMAFINKNYGFRVGDAVLKEVANRLRNTFRDYDLVAKVGGDEFALFIYPMRKREDALIVAEKLKEVLAQPVEIENMRLTLGMNAGVSIFPSDGRTFHELYEKASVALHAAKSEGENEVRFYDEEMERKAEGFVRAESLLEKAVRERLFVFEFQPYFRLKDMGVAGLEALLRIRERDGTLHYPSEFIDYLENSRFLRDFENSSLEELRRLLEKFRVPISLNVSARSFRNDEFMDKLFGLAEDFPGKLVVEITERLLVEDVERTKRILSRIREFAKVAVDDFGTGYSSLAYLKELPVDIVKIDMGFIRGMMESERDRALVEVIVEFAGRIGMESLAEGVETEEQLRILKEMGCTYAQGFYLARPMPEEKVEELLRDEG
ncbi:PAS domain S-box-containing protein/diguanylate cyclase (GGDEF)-like protein [Hydrogenivirga caldilitoris]|uniref:PAS domain S-box-containing protein/diguanylate cyclase (GGDEF)-like protein n=1 Tax=Hydrogenivirga caldilitoris TaxID=246264 RepID=A0A497XPR1_9AQUI|nr:EAL domain-containing protein [Hydrogenivirga caldilitoris]RLJ70878.1 PAS domain S-box-containing protein/diguanylate cyclase (GGDEF)-like protein [Hydrogenivirga caldilitoris]